MRKMKWVIEWVKGDRLSLMDVDLGKVRQNTSFYLQMGLEDSQEHQEGRIVWVRSP